MLLLGLVCLPRRHSFLRLAGYLLAFFWVSFTMLPYRDLEVEPQAG